MSVIPITGLRYLGNMPNPSTMIPNRGIQGKEAGNRFFNIPTKPMAPPLINNAIQPSTLRKVLGKANPNAVIVVRPPPVPCSHGMYPKTGIFRHEKKGLAYEAIPAKRIDGPIMPIADSNFAYLNSKLGQPK